MPEKIAVLPPEGIPAGAESHRRNGPGPGPDVPRQPAIHAPRPGQVDLILIYPEVDHLAEGRDPAVRPAGITEIAVDYSYPLQRPPDLAVNSHPVGLLLKSVVVVSQ